MSDGKMGAEPSGDMEKDAQAARVEQMTDAEFFSTPVHTLAPDRPLLRRPEPEYLGSQNMLDVLWHRSRWAPVDDAFDRGLEYAITTDPDMIEFQNWIMAVLALGLLLVSVKADDGSYRDARISSAAYPSLATALLKNLTVPCHVRTLGGIEHLFPAVAPTVLANCELWFKRDDVEALPCDDAAVTQVFEKLADAEANSADSAETAVAINSVMGWNAGTDELAPHPLSLVPQADASQVPQAVVEKSKPGNKFMHANIIDLVDPVLNGDYGGVPKSYPDFSRKILDAHGNKFSERNLRNAPYDELRRRYDEWAQVGGHKKRQHRINGRLADVD